MASNENLHSAPVFRFEHDGVVLYIEAEDRRNAERKYAELIPDEEK